MLAQHRYAYISQDRPFPPSDIFVPHYFTLYFSFPRLPRRRWRAPVTKRRGVWCGQGRDALEREKKSWRKCYDVYCRRASTPTHRLVTARFMVRPRQPRTQAVRARQEGRSSASCGSFPFLALGFLALPLDVLGSAGSPARRPPRRPINWSVPGIVYFPMIDCASNECHIHFGTL